MQQGKKQACVAVSTQPAETDKHLQASKGETRGTVASVTVRYEAGTVSRE